MSHSDSAAYGEDDGMVDHATLSFAVRLPEGVGREQLADIVAEALRPLADRLVNVSDLAVRTVPRLAGAGAAGYESRLWEKATCRSDGRPTDPLINPEVRLAELLDETHALRRRIDELEVAARDLIEGDG